VFTCVSIDQFTKRDEHELRLVPGDELRLKYPGGIDTCASTPRDGSTLCVDMVNKPWQSTGHVIKITGNNAPSGCRA